MLMTSAEVSGSHWVSILAAPAQDSFSVKVKVDVASSTKISLVETIQSVKYEAIVATSSQYERQNDYNISRAERSLHANQGHYGNNQKHFEEGAAFLRCKKDRYPDQKRGKHGHWQNSHLAKESLKHRILWKGKKSDCPSTNQPYAFSVNQRDEYNFENNTKSRFRKPKVAFSSKCSLRRSSSLTSTQSNMSLRKEVGSIVDDDALFRA